MGKSFADLWDQAFAEMGNRPELVRNRYEELLLEHGYKPIRQPSRPLPGGPQKAPEPPLRGVASDATYEPPESLTGT